ncbi:MAG: undecaprenyl-diphosphate phosphatase [Vicinamibacterales bacterium]
MTLPDAAILGVVQGLTEFLPVSSSAHLILAREFFGWAGSSGQGFDLAFDVFCHVGTLLAVIAFFRADIGEILVAVPRALRGASDPAARRVWLIVAGTVPVVVIGLLWGDALEALRAPAVAASALLAGAVLLLVIERLGAQGHGDEGLSVAGAFGIGVAQAAALVPGVSRSGATIAAGMALGMRREAAARFTFLMSIPAILGGAGKEALDLRGMALGAPEFGLMAVGLVTSAVVGYLTVRFFIRFLATHRLDAFAWYRAALAAATFVWLAVR